MKKLIIAEKPSLAKNIASALRVKERKNGYIESENYIVTWSFGHLFSLKTINDYLNKKTAWNDINLPFIPEKFDFVLKDDEEIKKQFYLIKNLIGRDDIYEIVNAGDSDREGQVIIDLIIEKSETKKPIKRVWLPEQTENTIKKEFENLRSNDNYKHLLNEGLIRSYMDWLFGINLTVLASIKSKTKLPLGRVLYPIVNIIYDRDQEIKAFKSEKYLQLESISNLDDSELKIVLNKKYNSEEKQLALEYSDKLNLSKARVLNIEEKKITKESKKLFSLSDLQGKISKDLKINFSDSLKIIQKLYENGYITYPRTNTEYLSENEKNKYFDIITNLNNIFNFNLILKDRKSIFNNSKVESHSAITPTLKTPNNSLSENENNIYNIILKRFASVFCSEQCIISQRVIDLIIGDEKLTLKGNSVKQKGFLIYEPQSIQDNLPNFSVGNEFEVSFTPIEKTTSAPKRYSEDSLSNFLKNPFLKTNIGDENNDENDDEKYKNLLNGLEIGTEATRTSIIDNAIKYDYIVLNNNLFDITEKGLFLINFSKKLKINLLDLQKTIEFSKLQKSVFNNELSITEVLSRVSLELNNIVSNSNNINLTEDDIFTSNTNNYQKGLEEIGKCPICNNPIYENEKSFYCSNYKHCSFKGLWKVNNRFFTTFNKKLTKTIAKQLFKNGKTKMKNLKTKKGNTYDAFFVIKSWDPYPQFEVEYII